jgi:hypothetical protein
MWFLRLRNKESKKKAEQALVEAVEAADEVNKLEKQVNSVTSKIHEMTRRNHFAETLEGVIIRPRRSANDA